MTNILTSTPIINEEFEKLKSDINDLKQNYRAPKMAVILVGNDPASLKYVKNKSKFCNKIGAECIVIKLDKFISCQELKQQITSINLNHNIDGMIVQLPLPKHLAQISLSSLIHKDKDLDCFNFENIYQMYKNDMNGILPCTPKGIVKLCNYYNISLEKKNITIIGRSLLVGKPLASILTNMNATVTLCHSKSNLEQHIKFADILIIAAGHCDLINPENFKPNKPPIVIDVGINITNGKLTGDCCFNLIKEKCQAITPVPKGIGPMTIWALLDNLIMLAKLHKKKHSIQKEG